MLRTTNTFSKKSCLEATKIGVKMVMVKMVIFDFGCGYLLTIYK